MGIFEYIFGIQSRKKKEALKQIASVKCELRHIREEYEKLPHTGYIEQRYALDQRQWRAMSELEELERMYEVM